MNRQDMAEILRMIAQVIAETDEVGDYIGPEEQYTVDVDATLKLMAHRLNLKADEIESGGQQA